MQRKELIVILVLAFVVVLAATVRLSRLPTRDSGTRRNGRSGRAVNRHFGSPANNEPSGDEPQLTLWPPPDDRLLPRDPTARRLFAAAETVAAEGLFDAATHVYARFLEKFPKEAAAGLARLRMAQCYTLTDRPAEAAEQYELFLQKTDDGRLRPMALVWSAESHLRIGKPAIARERLEEVVAKHSGSPFSDRAKVRLAGLDAPAGTSTPAPPKTPTP